MHFLPRSELRLRAPLPPREVRARLAGLVGEGLPFAGAIGADSFVASRRGSLLRFGLPRLDGQILPAGDGTELVVQLRLEPLFVGLYSVWLVLMLAASAALRAPVPILVALVVHVSIHASFAGEATLARQNLKTHLGLATG